ncbi:MAG: ABC transporter ATP-binding protein [Coriobacteriia bacterium]|nr:ABC transporter ATP-binding protein [Coriobacteriia bacterium]
MYLHLKRLTKEYDGRAVVDDLTLEIERGEFICLLGPSGCGKTTTLRMIGGFETPSRGEVRLEDEDITSLPPNRRPTATVFQSYALFPHMSVIENVAYGLRATGAAKKEAHAKASEMLDLVGLGGRYDSRVAMLSGGEQQRVALARALVVNPKVLLLDEPLSNLDAKLRERMRREIRALHSKLGTTTIHVTHDQEEALSLADRIVVINEGRVEQIGVPRDVYQLPATDFVADFIGRGSLIETADGVKFMRPENVSLSLQSGDIPGTVTQRQFAGAFVTYFVDTRYGSVQADVSTPADGEIPVGTTVWLSLEMPIGVEGTSSASNGAQA